MQKMRAVGVALTTALAMSGGALTMSAAPASAADQCKPTVSRSYAQTGSSWWLIAAAGTVKNTKAYQVREAVTFTKTGTRSTSVSGELGVSASVVVAEINSKGSFSVDRSVSYTSGRTITIVVGPRSTVHYKIGIKKRKFLVTQRRTYSNCKVVTSYGTVTAADSTTETS
ncbi:hypothetical protein [Streptomyces sp. bgisy153]|uniref:hypothetical protein n=1 Tax=Streptomyces sp. bgisy153 TaxID=3413793 RepID=UPI003D72AF74